MTWLVLPRECGFAASLPLFHLSAADKLYFYARLSLLFVGGGGVAATFI